MTPQDESSQYVSRILEIIEELNRLRDVDSILDRILYEARRFACADAGSIFLVKNGTLRFSYVQNDTLFRPGGVDKSVYMDFSVPLDTKSIVGFAAETGETVVIKDAYAIDPDRLYKFNPRYDEQAGYRTRSVLAIPLKTYRSKTVGVMQLINAKDETGRVVEFSEDSRTYLPLLANNAAVAVERGLMMRELVLRMMKMAELRDPSETGPHVQRVGAISAEIYHQWAHKRGMPVDEIKRTKDLVRIGAMLHDVGKVGISDLILKKPGDLSQREYQIMKMHTIHGARLFANKTSELDVICFDIALRHHEKWDGTGYPGPIRDLFAEDVGTGRGKKGEGIPLAARITALADVYDALSSKRSYKKQWSDEKILEFICGQAGRQFDPEVVEAFMDIFDVIKAISLKYREQGAGPEDSPWPE